jgi:hypothetical protein
MDDHERRAEIVRIEERIEELAAKIESCRKFAFAARIAMAAGAIVLAAIVFGAIRPDLTWMGGAMATILGGIVAFGSNNSTAKEAASELAMAEADRAVLIESIDLRTVPAGRTLH